MIDRDFLSGPDEVAAALVVVPALMNDEVVKLMGGEAWASEKALEGYVALHHLLLALARAYPVLAKRAGAAARDFVASPAARHKRRCPNLGEFLCLLGAQGDVAWEACARPLLDEAFDRNVLWAIKAHPELGTDVPRAERVSKSFAANTTSLKLLAFQAWFARNVAQPGGATPSAVLALYDRRKGVPPASLVRSLHAHCAALRDLRSYDDFFALCGLAPTPEHVVGELLERNLRASARKGYHGRARG